MKREKTLLVSWENQKIYYLQTQTTFDEHDPATMTLCDEKEQGQALKKKLFHVLGQNAKNKFEILRVKSQCWDGSQT